MTRNLHRLFFFVLLAVWVVPGADAAHSAARGEGGRKDSKGFTQLFNGKDLDGWYTFLQKHGKDSDPDRIITIENGAIHLYKHAKHGERAVMGYIGTDKEYSHYHLRLQYKWGEKKFKPRFELLQDAGLYYHMVGPDRVWPQALQFQIERTNVGDVVTVGKIRYETTIDPATKDEKKQTYLSAEAGGVPKTHGLRYITHLARVKLYEKEGWNDVEIIVRGDRVEHRLNGHVVARLTNARRPDPNHPDDAEKFIPLTKGRILLEIEAAEIFFRKVEIKELGADEATLGKRRGDVGFGRIKLDDVFRSEGVAVADVNHDGRPDVLAGDVWYEAPIILSASWRMHALRPVGKFDASRGYSQSFCNFAFDLNGDGWDDSIVIGFPGRPFHWYENPRNKPGHWKAHLLWHSACNETPVFTDLVGDAAPELVLGSQPESKLGYLPIPSTSRVTAKWSFQPISRAGDPMKNGSFVYYHGLGVGDLNNDGRPDVIIPHGWWEAPQESTTNAWTFHPFSLSKEGNSAPLKAANIYVEDLDLDGDNDIIMSSAHEYGIWWFEDVGKTPCTEYKFHLIHESYSQTHAMHFVDINGDGQKDIVTGKRYYAHNGRDPGGKEPVVMFWYEVHRVKGAPPKFIPHEIVAGRDTGTGTQFAVHDMNGDGRIDIVLSNKKGVNILLQQ